MSESDQGQPTGGQAGSVEATGNGTSWIEVSGRAGCELNTLCDHLQGALGMLW